MGAHPGGLLHRRPARRRLRRGLRLLGRRARRDAAATTTTTWIRALGARRRRPGGVARPARRGAGRGAAGQGRARLVARRRGGVPAGSRRAGRTGGSAPRCAARGISPTGCRASTPTRCSPARASPTSSAWLGVQLARARGRDVQLTAEIGLWGYDADAGRSVRAEPPQLPDARRCSATRRWCWARWSAARARRRSDVSAARRSTATATSTPRWIVPTARSSSARAAATTSRASPPSASSSRRSHPARTPERCGYITSPGRAVRALVTDLGILEKQRRRARADGGPGGDEPLAARIEAALASVRWDLDVVDAVAELPPPTAEEIATLRHWDPRGWFLRA